MGLLQIEHIERRLWYCHSQRTWYCSRHKCFL